MPPAPPPTVGTAISPAVTITPPEPPPSEFRRATSAIADAAGCGEAETVRPATINGGGLASFDFGGVRDAIAVAVPAVHAAGPPPPTTDQRSPVTRMLVAGYGARWGGMFSPEKYRRNSTSPSHRGGKFCTKNRSGSSA